MKRIIVSGANGFVGSHLVKKLLTENVCVYALVNNNTNNLDEINHNNLFILRDIQMLEGKKVDVFLHLGWEGNSGAARSDIGLQQKNIENACYMMHRAVQLGCEKFVFAGSVMEFEAVEAYIKDSNLNQGYIYSTSKLTADLYLRALSERLGIQYISLIISNIYGPGEKSPRLINTTVRKLLTNEKTSFSSATQQYDFIYIDDAVEKIYEILRNAESKGMYYIGNPTPRPLSEFLREIGQICIRSDNIGIGDLGESSQVINYSNIDMGRVERELGVRNKVSFLEGIKRTMNSIKGEI